MPRDAHVPHHCQAESKVRRRIYNWWVKGMVHVVPPQSLMKWGSAHPFHEPLIVPIWATWAKSSFPSIFDAADVDIIRQHPEEKTCLEFFLVVSFSRSCCIVGWS